MRFLTSSALIRGVHYSRLEGHSHNVTRGEAGFPRKMVTCPQVGSPLRKQWYYPGSGPARLDRPLCAWPPSAMERSESRS